MNGTSEEGMKVHPVNSLCNFVMLLLLAAVSVQAQQPTPSPKKAEEATVTATEAGEEAGDYIVTSSIELGYRGLSVDGDHNKYRSDRSEEHTSELQSQSKLVCRLLLEKKKVLDDELPLLGLL